MTQTSVTYHAQYSDGTIYAVLYDASNRKTYLKTTEGGFMDVPFYVNGASFVRFDFNYVPQSGLRACDVFHNLARLHKHIGLLTPPTKPAEPPPITHTEKDPKIHVESGGDSFTRLQEAGARATAEYETNRERARQQALQTMNERDERKSQEVRRINNEWAAIKRPRGGGQFIIKGE
jgi:hypothetical protein